MNKAQREQAMIDLRNQGKTYEEIGEAFGVTRQRVHQMIGSLALGQTRTSHGLCNTRLYKTYDNMIQRCTNPNHTNWDNYGGRGIKVCDDWSTFEVFRDDMGPKPKDAELDRIDNERGYEPDNCRWVSKSENLSNRRNWGASKHKGVTFNKQLKKWAAYIVIGGKRIHLGYFQDQDEAGSAVRAVNMTKKALQGFISAENLTISVEELMSDDE